MFEAIVNRFRVRDGELEDVRTLHRKFGILSFEVPGHLTEEKLKERFDFMKEELQEFGDAAVAQDMDKMLDALVDLVYVAKGTAVMLGLRLVWRAAWREVQRANMSKVRGVTHRGNKVDLAKPPGWKAPDHRPILKTAGYTRQSWFGPHGRFLEYTARSDERCGTCPLSQSSGCPPWCDDLSAAGEES